MITNEDVSIIKMDDATITPASITIIPDLYHAASGSIEVASYASADSSTSNSYYLTTSWRVVAPFEVDLTTSWNVGEPTFYWYRIEGECTPVACDTMGMKYADCKKMIFVTTVAARSIPEVCDILTNPRINAPADLKVTSIKRYTRPVFRDEIPAGLCNELQDVEFCQIPECQTYCADRPFSPLLDSVLEEPFVVSEAPSETPISEMSDEDLLVVSGTISASAVSMGYEYEDASSETIAVPTERLSVCGCSSIGLSIPIRHSLNRSAKFSRFLRSNALTLPETAELLFKARSSSWSSISHLRGSNDYWTLMFELGCESDLWKLSMSVRKERYQTKIVVDIPSEMICTTPGPSALVQIYFDQAEAGTGSGKRVQVVTPERTPPRSATSPIEIFVDGIFVPHAVYYDDLGIFDDSFWDYSPFEISINPISRNASYEMSLSKII